MRLKPRKKFLPIATAVFGKEEEREIIDTLRSGWITLGPKTKIFEEDLKKYVGSKYTIALNSCSAALHLSMIAIGIKEGDEVITTPLTFAATVHAIIHCGGKPVFADIDRETFNIDPDKIEALITKKTKAIIPVHYGGHPVKLDKIKKIAKKYNLYVIEDAAHAIGAEYKGKKIGTLSDLTCFSFHPVKNMTTGDGGAITTNNKKLAEKLSMLRVNGMDKESWRRNTSTGNWDYDISILGLKYHMNDLAASLGIHQLKKLDKFWKIRKQLVQEYDRLFKKEDKVIVPNRETNIKHAHNLYPVLLDIDKIKLTRNQVISKLKEFNIGSIVYFRPLHLQPFFQETLGYKKGDFPEAEYVFERLLCLPLYPGMKKEDAKYVVGVLREIVSNEG